MFDWPLRNTFSFVLPISVLFFLSGISYGTFVNENVEQLLKSSLRWYQNATAGYFFDAVVKLFLQVNKTVQQHPTKHSANLPSSITAVHSFDTNLLTCRCVIFFNFFLAK